jgi:hypothetical protein
METNFQMPGPHHASAERLLTIREAADVIGTHY